MDCERHTLKELKYSITSKCFLPLFFVVALITVFSNITPAFAVAKICIPSWTNTSPYCSLDTECIDADDGSVIFPSGTIAPAGGTAWNSVVAYPIPTSDTSFTINSADCDGNLIFTDSTADFGLVGALPTNPSSCSPNPYGAGSYYGTSIASIGVRPNIRGNQTGWAGAQPLNSMGLGWQNPTPIIVSPTPNLINPEYGGNPYGVSWGCKLPGNIWCDDGSGFYLGRELQGEPFDVRLTDPIIWLPDGEAMMVPMGTQVVRPSGTIVNQEQRWADAARTVPIMDAPSATLSVYDRFGVLIPPPPAPAPPPVSDSFMTAVGLYNKAIAGDPGPPPVAPVTPAQALIQASDYICPIVGGGSVPPSTVPPGCQTTAGETFVLGNMGAASLENAAGELASFILQPGDIVVPPLVDPMSSTNVLVWSNVKLDFLTGATLLGPCPPPAPALPATCPVPTVPPLATAPYTEPVYSRRIPQTVIIVPADDGLLFRTAAGTGPLGTVVYETGTGPGGWTYLYDSGGNPVQNNLGVNIRFKLDAGGNPIPMQATQPAGGATYLGPDAIQYLGGCIETPWTTEAVRNLQVPWGARGAIVGAPPVFSGGTGTGSGIGNNLPPACTVSASDAVLTIFAGGDITSFMQSCIESAIDSAILSVDSSANGTGPGSGSAACNKSTGGNNAYIDFEGGDQFAQDLCNWFGDDFDPDMKKMTEQLNVAVVDQSRNLGSMYDAETQTKTQNILQKKEIDAAKRLRPSENMCSMATATTGMQKSLQTSRVLKDAINVQSAARSLNLPGSGTENGIDGFQDVRWTNYCNVSASLADNAGFSGCPANGAIPGADIDVERFLFQDTIDMTNPNERIAAEAILTNLVDSKALQPLPPNFNSANARRIKLARDHYASLRQPLVDVVGGIISRRTGITNALLDPGVGTAIRDIRLQAGIPIGEVTFSPSYNEMMLARSKEYFFNVDKIIQSGNDISTVRQELVVNESLIAVTLQDIEELERQINAVLMTQAAMKLNADENSNTSKNLQATPKSRQ